MPPSGRLGLPVNGDNSPTRTQVCWQGGRYALKVAIVALWEVPKTTTSFRRELRHDRGVQICYAPSHGGHRSAAQPRQEWEKL